MTDVAGSEPDSSPRRPGPPPGRRSTLKETATNALVLLVLAGLVAIGLFVMLAVSSSSDTKDCAKETTETAFADCVAHRNAP
jgi:hypothetical protein